MTTPLRRHTARVKFTAFPRTVFPLAMLWTPPSCPMGTGGVTAMDGFGGPPLPTVIWPHGAGEGSPPKQGNRQGGQDTASPICHLLQGPGFQEGLSRPPTAHTRSKAPLYLEPTSLQDHFLQEQLGQR